MTLHGHIHQGAIVLDTPTSLPEGAAVQVHILTTTATPELPSPATEQSTLAERLKEFIGILDLPDDAAVNHDHYLYGAPKKQ